MCEAKFVFIIIIIKKKKKKKKKKRDFIFPVLPVKELPISQDWLDRMKLVHNCTIYLAK